MINFAIVAAVFLTINFCVTLGLIGWGITPYTHYDKPPVP